MDASSIIFMVTVVGETATCRQEWLLGHMIGKSSLQWAPMLFSSAYSSPRPSSLFMSPSNIFLFMQIT